MVHELNTLPWGSGLEEFQVCRDGICKDRNRRWFNPAGSQTPHSPSLTHSLTPRTADTGRTLSQATPGWKHTLTLLTVRRKVQFCTGEAEVQVKWCGLEEQRCSLPLHGSKELHKCCSSSVLPQTPQVKAAPASCGVARMFFVFFQCCKISGCHT